MTSKNSKSVREVEAKHISGDLLKEIKEEVSPRFCDCAVKRAYRERKLATCDTQERVRLFAISLSGCIRDAAGEFADLLAQALISTEGRMTPELHSTIVEKGLNYSGELATWERSGAFLAISMGMQPQEMDQMEPHIWSFFAESLEAYLPGSRHEIERKIRLRCSISSSPPRPKLHQEGATHNEEFAFRKEGEAWRITYECKTTILEHSKGFSYIAYLLQNPSRLVGAIELRRAFNGMVDEKSKREGFGEKSFPGGAQSLKNHKAITDCENGLREIQEELRKAERNKDEVQVKVLEEQKRLVARQLLDLRGRGGDGEIPREVRNARCCVRQAISLAMKKIGKELPHLQDHLSKHVQTGYSCRYIPPSTNRINWNF